MIVGCDVSKSVLDIKYHKLGAKPVYLGQFPNCENGFEEVINLLSNESDGSKANWFFCFENTGVYSSNLLKWLVAQGIPCKEENPIKISCSLGMRRGKDDKIDSMAICKYAYEKREVLLPSKLEKSEISKLKKLLSRRELLVKHRVALKVSMKEQKGNIDDDLFEFLNKENNELIEVYNMKIKSIETNIQAIINEDVKMKTNNELLQSIVGIGLITSAYMIGYTSNFEAFSNARKFACYCGVAPFPNSSGIKKGRMGVSHLANKTIKSLLSNSILSAITYDREIGIYYKRKKQEGKEPGIVMNAVKNKHIHRMFAVIKRGTPYVKLMNYA